MIITLTSFDSFSVLSKPIYTDYSRAMIYSFLFKLFFRRVHFQYLRTGAFCFVIFLLFPGLLYSQEHKASIDFIDTFKAVQQELPREHVYLHTDRNWYYHGDRIWFSVYTTAGSRHFPSEISSVLYVELVEPDGTVALREAIKLSGGRGEGSLLIDIDDEKTGTYSIIAYTKWGKNFGESYIFEKAIRVFSNKNAHENEYSDVDFDVTFLPESGHLIENIPTRLAFKALRSDGKGMNISGEIIDQNSGESIPFQSEHLGMGHVDFTPKPGATYVAAVQDREFPLPQILPQGIIMNVKSINNLFEVTVKTKLKEPVSSLVLFTHVRGEIYYASLLIIEDGVGIVNIPKEQFASGIVHFTVLNLNGQPAAERLAFNKNPRDNVTVQITSDETAELREDILLNLTLLDHTETAIPATASLTVYDDSIRPYNQHSQTIRSWFLLQSEIQGHVEDPGFYFSDNKNAEKALDFLLMTQGWRAYDMSRITDPEYIQTFSLPEKSLSVSGIVKTSIRKRPIENASVVASLGNDHGTMDLLTTDENGMFILDGIDFVGSKMVTVRANNEDGKDFVRIEMNDIFADLPQEYHSMNQPLNDITLPDSVKKSTTTSPSIAKRAEQTQRITEQFADVQMSGELDEITVTGEQIEEEDEFEQGLRTGERSGQRIDFDEDEVSNSLPFLIALNQIAGVKATDSEITVRTGFTNIQGGLPPPLIIIDNIESDESQLRQLNTADVKTVNVFRRGAELGFYGARAAGGAIVVQTRRGTGAPNREESGLISAFIEGYQPPTQFFTPKYGINMPADIEEPDNRITLHWESNLDIDEQGESVRFWTNDIPSTYRIIVEGITETGVPFSASKRFRIVE